MSLPARFTAGIGAYAAGLAAAATVVVAPPVDGTPFVVPALVGLGAGVGAGALAARVPTGRIAGFNNRLGPALAGAAPPLALLGVAYWLLETDGSLQSNPRFAGALGGIGLAVLGLLAAGNAAEHLWVQRVVADSEVTARLPGRYTSLRREYGWLLVAAGLAYLAVLAGLFVALDASWWLFPAQLGLVVPAWSVLHNPDLVVTDAGLVHGVSVTDWDAFESYELGDEYLSLHQAGWTKGRFRLPRDAIDDEERALDALSRHLPAADGETVDRHDGREGVAA